MVAAYVAYGVITVGHGGNAGYWSGFPFAILWGTDIGDGYTLYSGLYADIAIALVYVVVVMLLTEWLHRLQNKAVVASVLIVSAGVAAILLLWHTSVHLFGSFAFIEFRGAPFVWVSPSDYGPGLRVDSWPGFLGDIAVAFTVVLSLSFATHSVVRVGAKRKPNTLRR